MVVWDFSHQQYHLNVGKHMPVSWNLWDRKKFWNCWNTGTHLRIPWSERPTKNLATYCPKWAVNNMPYSTYGICSYIYRKLAPQMEHTRNYQHPLMGLKLKSHWSLNQCQSNWFVFSHLVGWTCYIQYFKKRQQNLWNHSKHLPSSMFFFLTPYFCTFSHRTKRRIFGSGTPRQ